MEYRLQAPYPPWGLLPPLFAALLGCTPLYSGPVSDHFDGSRFSNQPGVPSRPSFFEAMKWNLSKRNTPPWPGFVDTPPGPPPPERVADLRVTFVGHATFLLQQDGLNLLADPVWSPRAGPYSWLGTKRLRPPGIRFEELPPVDVVLLSHDHYDHLDLPTLRRLAEAFPNLTIITGLGNRAVLNGNGIHVRVVELDWWQSTTVGNLEISATPAAHWSGRNPLVPNRTLWVGFVVRGPAGVAYYAGDTGWGPHFAEIRERFGPLRLALLPIGAYKPEWFMRAQHIGPQEAIEAARVLEASTSIGLHFGTFNLADDGPYDAPNGLRATGPNPTFEVLAEGRGWNIPPSSQEAPPQPPQNPTD